MAMFTFVFDVLSASGPD